MKKVAVKDVAVLNDGVKEIAVEFEHDSVVNGGTPLSRSAATLPGAEGSLGWLGCQEIIEEDEEEEGGFR